MIHETAVLHPGVAISRSATVDPYCVLGSPDGTQLLIRSGSHIRSHSVIYGGVRLGMMFQTGHHALIRGDVEIGDYCLIGSYSSVEGTVRIGSYTRIRGRCEIPNSIVGLGCQIYAGTTFYDTPQPPDGPNLPPVIEDEVVIGCNAAVLGGVTVGARSFVAANAFVGRDVPPDSFVKRSGEIVPRR